MDSRRGLAKNNFNIVRLIQALAAAFSERFSLGIGGKLGSSIVGCFVESLHPSYLHILSKLKPNKTKSKNIKK
jgi:hypothetical protein